MARAREASIAVPIVPPPWCLSRVYKKSMCQGPKSLCLLCRVMCFNGSKGNGKSAREQNCNAMAERRSNRATEILGSAAEPVEAVAYKLESLNIDCVEMHSNNDNNDNNGNNDNNIGEHTHTHTQQQKQQPRNAMQHLIVRPGGMREANKSRGVIEHRFWGRRQRAVLCVVLCVACCVLRVCCMVGCVLCCVLCVVCCVVLCVVCCVLCV